MLPQGNQPAISGELWQSSFLSAVGQEKGKGVWSSVEVLGVLAVL